MEQWAIGISIVALAVAIVSAWFARREAVAAEDANRLSRQVLARAEQAESNQREANRVRWTVERVGSGFALRNVGTDAAHDVEAWHDGGGVGSFASGPLVTVEADPRRTWLQAASVPSNGSVSFGMFPVSAWQAHAHELLVRWAGVAEPVRVPLPESQPQPPTQQPWRKGLGL